VSAGSTAAPRGAGPPARRRGVWGGRTRGRRTLAAGRRRPHACHLRPLRLRLRVDGAITVAEEFGADATALPDPRRLAPLDAWITDLEARRAAIPCERERHRQCPYSGSGQAEKANDLCVARRQKNQGLHLMRLRTHASTAIGTATGSSRRSRPSSPPDPRTSAR